MTKTYYSHGKLLLTAEYVVLDHALALAIPTKFGQFLKIEPNNSNVLVWKSNSNTGETWFEAEFSFLGHNIICSIENDVSKHLIKILKVARKLNPDFLKTTFGYNVTTILEFPKNWGLGSSSTLLNNMAKWAQIDAFKLSEQTFGGSGYDIACAKNSKPIFFSTSQQTPKISASSFNPKFKAHLYFVHLNKKQNSRDGIKHYKAQHFDLNQTVLNITKITKKLSSTKDFDSFCELLNQHENIISQINNQEKVKELLFADFNGSIKSLGAWGGDFVLVATKENPVSYFNSKGFETVLSWNEMILE